MANDICIREDNGTHYIKENEDDTVLDPPDLLLEIVRFISKHPARVRIDVTKGQATTIMTINVAPDDRGQVIGKDHTTLVAIQHLFQKGAFLDGEHTMIRVGGLEVQRKFKGRRSINRHE